MHASFGKEFSLNFVFLKAYCKGKLFYHLRNCLEKNIANFYLTNEFFIYMTWGKLFE